MPYPASPEVIRDLMPKIINNIPATPEPWRPAVEQVLKQYGEERWNREKIAARVQRLADWNNSHGGGLRIWCGNSAAISGRSIRP